MKVFWSDEALKNLLTLVARIAEDAPERALAYARKIETKAGQLKQFPRIGRIVPELQEEEIPPRELLIDDYRLIYRLCRKHIEIVTLFHGARGFPLKD